MKGQTIIYYGMGKGKTTAAVGLAIRALGAGLRVVFLQFIKKEISSEIKVLYKLKDLKVEIGGKGFFKILGDQRPKTEHKKASNKLFKKAKNYLQDPKIDFLILDEVLDCVEYGLISEIELVDFILKKPENITLVLTGHKVSKKITKIADVVTEMKKIKHIYDKGVVAQFGIDF